jgi:RNA polymerase sigma-70 factor, ECF subfamily
MHKSTDGFAGAQPLADSVRAAQPLADSVRAAHEAGANAWPGVDLSLDDFARHVEALRDGRGGAEALARQGEDLFLACACAQGNARAIELFSRYVLSAVPAMVAHILPKGALLDDLLQSMREQLLVRRESAPPRIAAYRGTGPLAGWVRITATRAAIRLKKGAARFTEDVTLDGRADASTAGPEALYVRRQYAPLLNAAILAALDALPAETRALLRSYYVEGLTIDELAARDGIHRATAARRVHSARMRLLEHVRERAAGRLGIPDEEIDSLIHLVASRLEISLGGSRAIAPE